MDRNSTQMSINQTLPYKLLEETVGLKIKIIDNAYNEIPIKGGDANSSQKIVFQITER